MNKNITLHFTLNLWWVLIKFKQDKKCIGNRSCPGQHHICQGLFPWYSRNFPHFSIPMIIFPTFQGLENFQNIFQTFPGSIQTLVLWLRSYEQNSIENWHFRRNGVSLTKNFRYKGLFPNNHFSCQKTRWMDLLYGTRILAEISVVLSQFTCLTYGQTFRSWLRLPRNMNTEHVFGHTCWHNVFRHIMTTGISLRGKLHLETNKTLPTCPKN